MQRIFRIWILNTLVLPPVAAASVSATVAVDASVAAFYNFSLNLAIKVFRVFPCGRVCTAAAQALKRKCSALKAREKKAYIINDIMAYLWLLIIYMQPLPQSLSQSLPLPWSLSQPLLYPWSLSQPTAAVAKVPSFFGLAGQKEI